MFIKFVGSNGMYAKSQDSDDQTMNVILKPEVNFDLHLQLQQIARQLPIRHFH